MVNDAAPILAEQALARLRKLAEGNGLTPEQIQLLSAEEKIYTLEGILTLTPKCDTHSVRHPGAPGGKNRKNFGSFAEAQSEAKSMQEEFMQGRDWIDGALKELKTAPGDGWGLDGARIILPNRPALVFAATQACAACQGRRLITCQQCGGQGAVICPHCQGRKQEPCIACGGTGTNPSQPGQPCSVCHGNRYTTCRFCHGMGQLTCPTCHGKRGTPCPTCDGTGQISEEIAMSCHIETSFRISTGDLPSGLRRGLDRLGIANLTKGYADIRMLPAKKMDEDELPSHDDKKAKIETYKVGYEARLPYADLRMNFNGKKAFSASFGKRGALLDIPPFLDDALQPAREKLKRAAEGKIPLEAPLEARLIRDALALELSGRGDIKELRKLYSVGFSTPTAQEIFAHLRLALNRYTLHLRRIAAVLSTLLAGGFFAGLFLTSLQMRLEQGWPWFAGLLFDFAALGFMLLFGTVILNMSAYLVLERRFPEHPVSLRQKIGKTGLGMLAAIVFVFFVMLLLAPVKPTWILFLLGHL